MTKLIHGTVHKGMIKPGDMLEENEDVLIIRVQKPKKSKIDIIAKKPRETLNHSFVEEIIESTESGEGIEVLQVPWHKTDFLSFLSSLS